MRSVCLLIVHSYILITRFQQLQSSGALRNGIIGVHGRLEGLYSGVVIQMALNTKMVSAWLCRHQAR